MIDFETRYTGPGADDLRSTDQVFTMQQDGLFSHINIGKLERMIERDASRFAIAEEQPLTAEVAQAAMRNDPDPNRLRARTADDIGPDCFAVGLVLGYTPEGLPIVQIGDGTHYTLKRFQLGLPTFRLLLVPPEIVAELVIHMEYREGSGPWIRVSPEEMVAETAGTYSQPDGTIRDGAGNVLDVIPGWAARQ